MLKFKRSAQVYSCQKNSEIFAFPLVYTKFF